MSPASALGEQEVVAEVPGAVGLTAYGGHVVWSAPDPATGSWRLMRWHDGAVAPLAVPERSVPFDADVGPDRRGRPVVVFSRCGREPPMSRYYAMIDWTKARRCDIWRLSLGGGVLRRVRGVNTAGGSETTPSIWGDSIVFQRRRPGRSASRLLLRPRVGAALRRLAVGSRGPASSTLPSQMVSAIDIGPRAVAFIWVSPVEYGHADVSWELWVDSLRTGRRTPVDFGGIGECNFFKPRSPNAQGLGVLWIQAEFECGLDPTGSITRYDHRSGQAGRAETTDLALEAARDGNTTWWLRGSAVRHGDRGAFEHPELCSASATPCELVRSTSLAFSPFALPRPYPSPT
jgi:hypothetical protein